MVALKSLFLTGLYALAVKAANVSVAVGASDGSVGLSPFGSWFEVGAPGEFPGGARFLLSNANEGVITWVFTSKSSLFFRQSNGIFTKPLSLQPRRASIAQERSIPNPDRLFSGLRSSSGAISALMEACIVLVSTAVPRARLMPSTLLQRATTDLCASSSGLV